MSDNAPQTTATLPPTLADAIKPLAAALAAVADGDHLGISNEDSPRYVQFAVFGPNLRAESVGNQYLPDGAQLGRAELDWLVGHGWNEPDEGGNFWRHWEPADHLAAATVAIATLHRVHGVERHTQLAFESFDPEVLNALTGGAR